MNLLSRTKKNCFANIYIGSTTDNNEFWEIVNCLSRTESLTNKNLRLVENDTILIDNYIVADTFNYLNNIAKTLFIQYNQTSLENNRCFYLKSFRFYETFNLKI